MSAFRVRVREGCFRGSAGLRMALLASAALACCPVSRAWSQAASTEVQLDTIDVQGKAAPAVDTPPGTTGYVATQATAATKTNPAVREVSQSISTVTREQLNDRDVQSLNQAIQYSPGASTNVGGSLADFGRIYIHGFSAITDVYRDGLRPGTFRNADVALVDAVVDYDVGQADPRLQGLRLQVNATNLFDTRYQSCQGGYCGINEGQQIIGSAIYRL